MKGIYCLIIDVKKDVNLKVGKLGTIKFYSGTYAYVGSAQNNLEKRLERHFSKNKRLHWHIDYLLASSAVYAIKALYKNAKKEEECKIAGLLSLIEGSVKGFGCSDCGCYSHLFRITNLKRVMSKMGNLKEVKNVIYNKNR